MAYYKDLREHIRALEEAGKLLRMSREINKDTELHPVVRAQFHLPEKERKAFLFDNVVDAKGRSYPIPVLVGALAASREIYGIGMMCPPEEIVNKWVQSQLHPVEPVMLTKAPVQEEVHIGEGLLEHGGLDEFPIPISTPGFDNAPYIGGGVWVSKDPDTGIPNLGMYRGMIKSQTRIGLNSRSTTHLGTHRSKYKKKGIPMPAAVVVGVTPNLGYCATSPLPFGVNEFAVAGGIAMEPVPLVKCKSIDLEVPANAELVVEGFVPSDYLEREGPFGEYTGHMGKEELSPFLNVTCITHRRKPIFQNVISQFQPSESTVLRGIAARSVYVKFLRVDCSIEGVLDVAEHQTHLYVIRMKKSHFSEPWRALEAVAARSATSGKIVVAVDEDIDPDDLDSVLWALLFRMQPHLDIRIIGSRAPGLDPSAFPPDLVSEKGRLATEGSSAMLIDATRKWNYSPVSLPRKEFMEKAWEIWGQEGWSRPRLKVPWYGYPLGHWTKENEEEAELALKGEHYQTGEKLAQKRVPG